jgi:hypothetical protein
MQSFKIPLVKIVLGEVKGPPVIMQKQVGWMLFQESGIKCCKLSRCHEITSPIEGAKRQKEP